MRYLTIALTKGRLAKKTLELLEKTGITCEEMKDPASRKLIFSGKFTRCWTWASENAGCAFAAPKRTRSF